VEPWRAARAATERGDLDAAESACQQAIACRPAQADPYYLLGILRQARDDHAAALVAFRQALYVDRAFVPALLGLATLHRQRGQTDRAQRALERARRLLAGRPDDEPILSEEPVTVGRLRQVLDQTLGAVSSERH
jgi:tetratricopeptide (TPR) repeat protein